MDEQLWTTVDRYFARLVAVEDAALAAALERSARAGLPPHQVSPAQGKMLQILAQLQGAASILEIGTLGGYSTIWLARALPSGGRLITLEVDPNHGEVARANVAAAGLADVVEVRIGSALDTLPRLVEEGAGPFDLIFVDADKANSDRYLHWALELSRAGTLLVFDNVVRRGAVADGSSGDPAVQGIRRLMERLGAEPRLDATAIQTVGEKGYDGFAVARVVEPT